MHQDHNDRHVTRLGDNDVYLIDLPAILAGGELERLSLALRVPRPVYPLELVHRLINEAAYRLAWQPDGSLGDQGEVTTS